MKPSLFLIAALVMLTSTVGCEWADTSDVDRESPSASQPVATKSPDVDQQSTVSLKTSEAIEESASEPALANDVNWQIFKTQLSQYELNKEADNENDD